MTTTATTTPPPRHRLFRHPQVRRLRRLYARIGWRLRRGFVVVEQAGMTADDCRAELEAQYIRAGRDAQAYLALLEQDQDIQQANEVLNTMEFCENVYRLSRNPVFAIRAYRLHQDYGIPLPRWLRRYVGDGLMKIDDQKPDTLNDIAKLLGFGATPGPSDYRKAATVERDLRILSALEVRFTEEAAEEFFAGARSRTTNEDLFTEVAAKLEEPYQTVYDTFYRYSEEPPALRWLPAYVRRRRLLLGRWCGMPVHMRTRPPRA